ncbi:GPR83 [Branchiostoma lanceolatum]|uniref:GPR83 protein n=1 Tax=Branchiostoma lanceolatum TaxID=7740 RepID=A0A8K0EA23_BRALA|nr:GPR83 [Branchiostoma lanceolatum]
MNMTEVFTEPTDAAGWFFGTEATPVPTTGGLPPAAGCTLTEPTRCGIYGAAPFLQPLLILIWLGILFWSLFGNGCLLAAMGTTMDMEERGNYFLAGMAVADILLALVHAPASISSLVSGEPMTEGWCKIQAFLSPGAFNLSMSFMTGLWYCRYRYIVYPLTYQATVTTRRIAVAMVMSVVISFLPPAIFVLRHSIAGAASANLARPTGLTIPCNVGGPERSVSLVVDILQFGVCTFCIVRVLFEARKHRVQIANQVPALAWVEQDNAWKVQMKIVYTHLITVGVNSLTWLPILAIGGMLTSGTLVLNNATSVWLEVFWMVNQTSTFSDSVVFAFRYEIYRKALRQLVRKIRQLIDELQYD